MLGRQLSDAHCVSKSSNRRDPPTARPISKTTITVWAIVVLGIDVAVLILLKHRYGGAGPDVELNAIRTAGTLLVVTGGAAALLLAALRHRSTVLTLVHTDRDATERRITELYTKAADQLGSDQAPVRLAGLYALERLANSTVEHRQTIVNVICAYLRMPYTPPAERPGSNAYRNPRPRRRQHRAFTDRPAASPPLAPRHQRAREERQVRLTAQDILSRNLRVPQVDRRRWWQWKRTPEAAPPWPGIRLDLTGALLIDFNLAHCQLYKAGFGGAQFTGNAGFAGARFTRGADFGGARFTGDADFGGAQFIGIAYIVGAQFAGNASFGGAQFTRVATFANAQFTGVADFGIAQFTDNASFRGAQFSGGAHFRYAQSTGVVDFERARVALNARAWWPPGWTVRSARPDEGEDPGYQYLVRAEDMATEET